MERLIKNVERLPANHEILCDNNALESAKAALIAAKESRKPVAYMRKWFFDGEKPYKEKNKNGRLAWVSKFKWNSLTPQRIFQDDIPLYADDSQISINNQSK